MCYSYHGIHMDEQSPFPEDGVIFFSFVVVFSFFFLSPLYRRRPVLFVALFYLFSPRSCSAYTVSYFMSCFFLFHLQWLSVHSCLSDAFSPFFTNMYPYRHLSPRFVFGWKSFPSYLYFLSSFFHLLSCWGVIEEGDSFIVA